MTFVFWQNMVSIHQSALIKACASRHRITLVVPKLMENERLNDGWQVPDMGDAELVIEPTESEIEQLLHDNDIHVFSGINAYPLVYSAFKKAVAYRKKVIVYAEPYDNRGIKGVIRYCMYRYLAIRYGKHIAALLATGEKGVSCYQKVGFSPDKVLEWAYFTEHTPTSTEVSENSHTQILYIGQLIERKAILPLIGAFKRVSKHVACSLRIIGDGPLRNEVNKMLQDDNNIQYLGRQSNDQIPLYLSQTDLLVLPSYHDGWGAVVNEALQAGCRVLCSTECGAASLLDGEMRGGSFNWAVEGDLERQLSCWCRKGSLAPSERLAIQEWSKKSISGTASVTYLERIVEFTDSQQEKPIAPWHKSL